MPRAGWPYNKFGVPQRQVHPPGEGGLCGCCRQPTVCKPSPSWDRRRGHHSSKCPWRSRGRLIGWALGVEGEPGVGSLLPEIFSWRTVPPNSGEIYKKQGEWDGFSDFPDGVSHKVAADSWLPLCAFPPGANPEVFAEVSLCLGCVLSCISYISVNKSYFLRVIAAL